LSLIIYILIYKFELYLNKGKYYCGIFLYV
jgi:hypothetical protein